jgi:hypothetical protein
VIRGFGVIPGIRQQIDKNVAVRLIYGLSDVFSPLRLRG